MLHARGTPKKQKRAEQGMTLPGSDSRGGYKFLAAFSDRLLPRGLCYDRRNGNGKN